MVIERTSGRGGELQLQRRGPHFEIIYNGVFLMATYNGAAERAMVARALESLSIKPPLRVFIGGLGVGYSLREALDRPGVAQVVVAEIEPAVIRWNRTHLAAVNGGALEDPRVTLVEGDCAGYLERAAAGGSSRFHLVALDTDNGSTWLSRPGNARLYTPAGLETVKRCLEPGGAACIWVSRREPSLEEDLRGVFGRWEYAEVEEETGLRAGFYLSLPRAIGKTPNDEMHSMIWRSLSARDRKNDLPALLPAEYVVAFRAR